MILPNIGILSKGHLTHNKPVRKPLASCYLINLEFLRLQTEQFDENILLLFIFLTFGFLLSAFFLYFKQ